MEQHILIHNNADYISAVKIIKDAILKSRYRAAQKVNHEMLALYYGIGGFISFESRNAQWGTGAIKAIPRYIQEKTSGLHVKREVFHLPSHTINLKEYKKHPTLHSWV